MRPKMCQMVRQFRGQASRTDLHGTVTCLSRRHEARRNESARQHDEQG
jgi:hypothetical protein